MSLKALIWDIRLRIRPQARDLGLEIGSNRAGLIEQPSVLKNNSNNKKRRKSAN